MSVVTGGCLCGAVRFHASAEPLRVTHCHCSICRRATGAAVGTFATFATDAVVWTGEPNRYHSSKVAWRGFCPKCGSSICFGYRPRPERTYVAIGIVDQAERFPASCHDYREAKLPWLHLNDDLPDAAALKSSKG